MAPEMKRVGEVCWEIPKTYKPGMRVPARIYATEPLLKTMDDGVYEQVTNMATLPGIVKASMAMPDAHWGYGFCVGGVAAFDAKEGIISPGGIGYDINCLAGDTRILLEYGCFKKIRDLEKDVLKDDISFMDLSDNRKKHSKAFLFLKKKPDTRVLRITTKNGEHITLTEDHPIYTGQKMIDAGKLEEGNHIITHPFEGVEYEKPPEEIIVDENKIRALVGNRKRIISSLKKRGLLPLRMNSEKLPMLTKLLGFLTGDGWLGHHYNRKRKQDVFAIRAIGKLEDLKKVMDDVNSMGYDIHFTSTKHYKSKISEVGCSKREISGVSNQLSINSQSFSVLMKALGLPEGNKSRTIVTIPSWVRRAPLWIKRLYLAGLFGAELTKPCLRKGESYGFTEPSFSQNKIRSLEASNRQFLLEIAALLSEFGVSVNNIYNQRGVINSYGEETIKLSLRLSANTENLIRLWSRIGYEYCKERKERSMLALAYLKMKRNVIQKTRIVLEELRTLADNGAKPSLLYVIAKENGLSIPMVKGQLYRSSTELRITSNFPTFTEFCCGNSIQNSEFIEDQVEKIESVEYNDYVYDFTMNEVNHNFIANCIVSHNCGMRLLTTNLTFKDVKPKLRQVVDLLFETVPTGVGCEGSIKLSQSQFDEVMSDGSEWCARNGYAWKEDVERTEENGKLEQADPSKVSQRARSRGIKQLGTLGSGNHYLEIQVAGEKEVFDSATAKAWGITEPDQVVVMFHCGSRGFGHQICSDYVELFLRKLDDYKISLPDRELACAPFQSREGQDYFGAMCAAINFSFASRQVILHRVREAFAKVFKTDAEKLGMDMVYDVAHNTAKIEEYKVDGKKQKLVVHRKGATRCFGPSRPELEKLFRKTGQPVIVGGSMETGSYLCVGTDKADDETFASTMHGSGRTMSRAQAKREIRGDALQRDMEKRGIYVRSASMSGLAEEAGVAYKDIHQVVETMDIAGISKRVVALRPVGNIKG